MNAIIDFLQGIDGRIIPPLLFALFLLGLGWLIFSAVRRQGRFSNNTMGHSMSGNSDTFADLRNKWAAQRNYNAVLVTGPIPDGIFKSWFGDETKVCQDFVGEREKRVNERDSLLQDYPKNEHEYLQVVGEVGRRPGHWAIYLGLLALLAVEAFGFALIFADKLSDTATANMSLFAAVGYSAVIAAVFLFLAEKTGRLVYKQGYSRQIWLESKGGLLAAEHGSQEGKSWAIDDFSDKTDKAEKFIPRIIRISNRSKYVSGAFAETKDGNKPVPRFRNWFYAYVVVVLAFGAFVGNTRLTDIDTYYKNKLEDASHQRGSQSDTSSESVRGKSIDRPPAVSDSAKEEQAVVSQEVLESEKKGKQVAVAVFVLIFFIVQTVGVIIASHHGFVSDEGENAYKKIRDFKMKYGDISLNKFTAQIDASIKAADRYAQTTLKDWQLGLQAEFSRNNMPLKNQAFVASCVNNMDQRTYSVWLEKSGYGVMQPDTPKSQTETPNVGEPAVNPNAPVVDYLVQQEDGNLKHGQSTYEQLRGKVGDLELDARTLRVKDSSTGEFINYTEFVQKQKNQPTGAA